jgi:acetyl-CoA carboxylase biotin carboxyl carrier protein
MADLGRELAQLMTPPKTRADRVAPLAAAFATSDLMRLAITDGDFSLEMIRRTVPITTSTPRDTISTALIPPLVESDSAPEATQKHTLRAELVGIVRFPASKPTVGATIDRDREIFAIEALGVRTPVYTGGKGLILDILVHDGSPVEYGQALLVIERV